MREKCGSAPDGSNDQQTCQENRADGEQDCPEHLWKFAVLLIDGNEAGNCFVQSEGGEGLEKCHNCQCVSQCAILCRGEITDHQHLRREIYSHRQEPTREEKAG